MTQPPIRSKKKPSYLLLFQEGRASLSLSLLLAISLVALDVLIVNTVLPNILEKLEGVQLYAWAIGIYSLGNFITIPIFSVLVSRIGGRLSYTIALLIFLLGSITGGASHNMEWVVVGRFLQGLGSGGFFAIPFALITRFYPNELQPRAIGLVSAVWGAAAIAGPLLGAAILELFGWRWVFWFNVPVGLIILALAYWALRGEGPPPNPKAPVNWAGSLLFAGTVACLLEAFNHSLLWALVLIISGVLFFAILLRHESKHSAPVLPLDVWKFSRPLGVACIGMLLITSTFGAAETYLPLLLQGLWKYSPLEAGLILTVGSMTWSFTSMFTARFADHPKRMGQLGSLLLFFGGLLLLFIVQTYASAYWIYFAWAVAGIGMGQVVPIYNTLAMDVEKEYPNGVSTGAVLLFLTGGFALGPPIAGLFARRGFALGFDPSMIGKLSLSPQSTDALQSGGLLALLICIGFGFGALIVSFWLPKNRYRSLLTQRNSSPPLK